MPKIEMNMPELPEGWEYTGGAWLTSSVDVGSETIRMNVYVRRVPKWRPATIDDIDKGLKARFWDHVPNTATEPIRYGAGTLGGWRDAGCKWMNSNSGIWWEFCEVLDSETKKAPITRPATSERRG